MTWGLNKHSNTKKVVISLTDSEVRLFLVEKKLDAHQVIDSQTSVYESVEQLTSVCLNWLQKTKTKGLDCSWLLARSLYKTVNIKKPNLAERELDNSVHWLVKDQIDQPLDSVLVTHYQPESPDKEIVTAVIAERELIESLIQVSDDAKVNLVNIGISELTSGIALLPLLNKDEIVGLIDEDRQGLIYNFYVGSKLAFTRHIKGRFFPPLENNPFSLESDDRQSHIDRFLLETQRTLDYCVNQVFRKPVSSLIIDSSKMENTELQQSLEQITEIPVAKLDLSSNHSKEPASQQTGNTALPSIVLTVAEMGCAIGGYNQNAQSVNFYLPQYQPKPLEFGFKFASGITATLLVGFVIYGYLQEVEQQSLNKRLAIEQKALIDNQTALKELNKKLSIENRQIDINKLITNKQKELKASRKLLDKVSTKLPNKAISYSRVFAELSRQNPDSLWLTKIELSSNSINLSGQTSKPKSIPIYINEIAKNPILSSQFESLSITRDDQNTHLVNFDLTNGQFNHAE